MEHEISKYIEDTNNTTSQLDPVDIYRTRHPTASEYTFKAHDYFTMINYMLIYKTSKNIF